MQSQLTTQNITQQAQNFYSQAKGFVSSTLDQAKDALGFNTYPQSSIQHSQPFLDDIARGSWSLNSCPTQENYQPVVGEFPSGWSLQKNFQFRRCDRTPFLNEIKQSRTLKSTQTNDRSTFDKDSWRGWKMSKPIDRKALYSQITGFQMSKLRPVGFKELPFLSELNQGNWILNRIEPQVKTQPVVGDIPSGWNMNQNVQLKKIDRAPLLGEIQQGADLKHVQTNDKSGNYLENLTDFKLKPAINRQALNSEIEGFQGSSLQHIGAS